MDARRTSTRLIGGSRLIRVATIVPDEMGCDRAKAGAIVAYIWLAVTACLRGRTVRRPATGGCGVGGRWRSVLSQVAAGVAQRQSVALVRSFPCSR